MVTYHLKSSKRKLRANIEVWCWCKAFYTNKKKVNINRGIHLSGPFSKDDVEFVEDEGRTPELETQPGIQKKSQWGDIIPKQWVIKGAESESANWTSSSNREVGDGPGDKSQTTEKQQEGAIMTGAAHEKCQNVSLKEARQFGPPLCPPRHTPCYSRLFTDFRSREETITNQASTLGRGLEGGQRL